MSGMGRGRGRAKIGQMLNEQKPGGDSKAYSTMDGLTVMINSLSIEPAKEEILPVSDAAKKFCTNKAEMEALVDLLYKRCGRDWQFSRCAATLCERIISIQVEQESFRNVLLQTIQKDFKEKDDLRNTNHPKFLGCLSFLCQVFAISRVNDKPFMALLDPVLQSLRLLLSTKASDDEVKCAAFHLVDLHPILHHYCQSADIISLRNTIKDKIVENSSSQAARYQLIHIVELFARLKAAST